MSRAILELCFPRILIVAHFNDGTALYIRVSGLSIQPEYTSGPPSLLDTTTFPTRNAERIEFDGSNYSGSDSESVLHWLAVSVIKWTIHILRVWEKIHCQGWHCSAIQKPDYVRGAFKKVVA